MLIATRYTAIVHSRDAIRFLTTAPSQPALFERLAEYVLANAEHQLWSADSVAIADLLRQRNFESAVERYFASVGERWDEEWIVYLDSRAS